MLAQSAAIGAYGSLILLVVLSVCSLPCAVCCVTDADAALRSFTNHPQPPTPSQRIQSTHPTHQTATWPLSLGWSLQTRGRLRWQTRPVSAGVEGRALLPCCAQTRAGWLRCCLAVGCSRCLEARSSPCLRLFNLLYTRHRHQHKLTYPATHRHPPHPHAQHPHAQNTDAYCHDLMQPLYDTFKIKELDEKIKARETVVAGPLKEKLGFAEKLVVSHRGAVCSVWCWCAV